MLGQHKLIQSDNRRLKPLVLMDKEQRPAPHVESVARHEKALQDIALGRWRDQVILEDLLPQGSHQRSHRAASASDLLPDAAPV